MAFRSSCASQKIKYSTWLISWENQICLHFKSCICSSSSKYYFNGTKHRSWHILQHKYVEKNKQCKQIAINPKAQAIFVHTFVNVIFKYML